MSESWSRRDPRGGPWGQPWAGPENPGPAAWGGPPGPAGEAPRAGPGRPLPGRSRGPGAEPGPPRAGRSRRQFLRRAAGAGAVVAAGFAAGAVAGGIGGCGNLFGSGGQGTAGGGRGAGSSRRPAGSPIRAENALPGERHWWLRRTGPPDAIEGFTDRASALPGEPVGLYVSTTAREFRVVAFRMGWYAGDLARRVWSSGPVRGRRQAPPTFTRATRTVSCDWHRSLELPTADWPPGCYLLRLDGDNGAQRYVPLTIRSATTAGKIVFKNAVETWQAYNLWGGYDLYQGPGGYGDRSYAVSLDRPYAGKGAEQFLVFERKLVNLVERLGLDVAYVTGMDIDADPRLLDGARALISPGHDEYWTPPERAHVTAARDAGVNVAFFGANAMFRRTRLAPTRLGANRLVICYKTSYTLDPMYGRDNALVTSDWRDPPHPDPESSLTGTLYESNPTTADYVVAVPDAWMFAGTGVRKGTRFRGLVGDEYDRVNPVYPVERPIEIVSHSPLTCRGVHSYSDSAYYTHPGGAGVFNTGTMRWVQSLAPVYGSELGPHPGRFTRRVTANVLRAFAEGPAAHAHPARDNLAAMHEWPGDPIAAGHNLWPPIVL